MTSGPGVLMRSTLSEYGPQWECGGRWQLQILRTNLWVIVNFIIQLIVDNFFLNLAMSQSDFQILTSWCIKTGKQLQIYQKGKIPQKIDICRFCSIYKAMFFCLFFKILLS
ncbi:hypothetical protein FKM82_028961 [Ascaphus truei]